MRPLRLFLAALLLSNTAFASENNPFNIDKELDDAITSGLYDLYNLDFDKALATFEKIKSESEEHPMVAFGIASVHWWRLSVYVLEGDEKESQPFLKAVDECLRVSKKKIDEGKDPTGEAQLTMGGIEGLLGRWEGANRQWVSAYFRGRSAIKNLRRALKVNPELKDAYMGLGIFDYYVAALPALVRVLAFLGGNSDKQLGLDELTIAGNQGKYARVPALLFLVNIYSTLENKPEKALDILEKLKGEYPLSPFIHMLRIMAQYNHGSDETLAAEANDFAEKVKTGAYRAEFKTQAHFALGVVPFRSKNWDAAQKEFETAVAEGTVHDPFFTWSHLYLGYALDAQKKRKEALAEYQTVLRQIRRWSSHESAQARKKRPFSEKDEEMKKLIL